MENHSNNHEPTQQNDGIWAKFKALFTATDATPHIEPTLDLSNIESIDDLDAPIEETPEAVEQQSTAPISELASEEPKQNNQHDDDRPKLTQRSLIRKVALGLALTVGIFLPKANLQETSPDVPAEQSAVTETHNPLNTDATQSLLNNTPEEKRNNRTLRKEETSKTIVSETAPSDKTLTHNENIIADLTETAVNSDTEMNVDNPSVDFIPHSTEPTQLHTSESDIPTEPEPQQNSSDSEISWEVVSAANLVTHETNGVDPAFEESEGAVSFHSDNAEGTVEFLVEDGGDVREITAQIESAPISLESELVQEPKVSELTIDSAIALDNSDINLLATYESVKEEAEKEEVVRLGFDTPTLENGTSSIQLGTDKTIKLGHEQEFSHGVTITLESLLASKGTLVESTIGIEAETTTKHGELAVEAEVTSDEDWTPSIGELTLEFFPENQRLLNSLLVESDFNLGGEPTIDLLTLETQSALSHQDALRLTVESERLDDSNSYGKHVEAQWIRTLFEKDGHSLHGAVGVSYNSEDGTGFNIGIEYGAAGSKKFVDRHNDRFDSAAYQGR